jgi:hypothetical protein
MNIKRKINRKSRKDNKYTNFKSLFMYGEKNECVFQYMTCDHWFSGICSGRSCGERINLGRDCDLPDC